MAGWLMTRSVPLGSMLTILVPLGIPVPLMNMPAESAAVLETVTVVCPAVVEPPPMLPTPTLLVLKISVPAEIVMLLMFEAAEKSALAGSTVESSWNCPFRDWKVTGPLPKTEKGVVVAGVLTVA